MRRSSEGDRERRRITALQCLLPSFNNPRAQRLKSRRLLKPRNGGRAGNFGERGVGGNRVLVLFIGFGCADCCGDRDDGRVGDV